MARALRLPLGRRSFLAAACAAPLAHALGRTPLRGRLRLALPWPITYLDPAALNDGFSALFAAAVFEPLFGLDASGAPYPSLADALPNRQANGARLTLRPSLKTGAGRALSGADVIATLARARSRGASGVLGELDTPKLDAQDPLSVVFPRATPDAVARALTSPLTALVPRGFSPLAPDGCGAFKVELSRGRALLVRNPNAARGPAFLDAIEVTAVSDLAELLRGFEAGGTDVGWLGTGLYRSSKDAIAFEAPSYGFAVLSAGKAVGAWGAPGTLQALLDTVPARQLAHLGLRGMRAQPAGSAIWGGPSTSMSVAASAPQMVAIARALAATLSSPGHDITVVERTSEQLEALQSSQQFGLLLDFVRAPSSSPRELELALRTAASPEAAKRAPRTSPVAPRELGRQLSLGVVGELAVQGARRSAFQGLETWQLGAVSTRAGA